MTGMTDIHCHILPGVDDGAKDMDMAAALLQKEYQDGVRAVIATPHYRRGMFEASMERILEAFGMARDAAARLGMDLYLGCEFHVNMDMGELLASGQRPTLANSRYVLCEFSSSSEAAFLRERSSHLKSRGFVPVLAHVERYPALTKNFDLMEELSELGCLMQVNAGSILGEDGFQTKRFCKKMIDYGFLDLVGSDSHDLKRRIPRMGECAAFLEKKYGSACAEKILCENPRRIIENR